MYQKWREPSLMLPAHYTEAIRRRRSDKKEGHESGQQEYEEFTF